MSDVTPNAELAYAGPDDIDADPASWDQGWWFKKTPCGTTGCYAGRIAIRSGYEPDFNEPDMVVGQGEELWTSSVFGSDDDLTVFNVARDLLRVSSDDAQRLFFFGHTRETLGEAVAEIFGPRPGTQEQRDHASDHEFDFLDEASAATLRESYGDIPPNPGSAS